MKLKNTLVLAMAAVLAAGLTACGSSTDTTSPAADSTAAESTEAAADGDGDPTTLTVAMECAYAPYNWTQSDDANGAVEIRGSSDYAYGYDVMMAKKIGEALGQKVQIVKLDWDSLIPAVMSGDVDCVIAGQSITADRAAQVDFSDPYYYASIITLTKKDSAYANATSVADLAGSHCDAPTQGLTAQGRDFVRALYTHRMLPDVSHLSEAAAWDVVRLGLGPVIASHANSRAVCAHTRNLPDDLFCAIRDSGGVVGLNLYTDFLGGDGMDAIVRHVEHLLDLGGDKTLALGGDLDGCDTLGGGITGVQDYPTLYAALAARGYDTALLQDLFTGNWLRVLPKS